MGMEVLSTFVEAMNSLAGGIASIILALIAIFALTQCFFGFKIMKIFFAIWGFLLGTAVGVLVSSLAFGGEMIGAIVVSGLVVGVLGAFLLYKMYLVGVFLTDMTLSFLLFSVLLGFEVPALIISGLLSIIIGILAAKFVRVWTIVLTGTSGGVLAGSAIAAICGVTPIGLHILFGVIIAVLGILFQFKSTKSIKKTPSARKVDVITQEKPAEPMVSKEASNTTIPAEPKVLDPKKKKLILAVGGGALALLLVIALVIPKGPAKPKAGFEKMNYVAADGKDISRSAIWFGAHSLEGESPVESIEYYSGKENKVIVAYGPIAYEDYTDYSYYLSDTEANVLLSGIDEITYIGDADGEPVFYIYKDDFYGIVDAKGEILADFNELGISSDSYIKFHDDILLVKEDSTGKYGALDADGNLVIPFSLDYMLDNFPTFNNGYLRVSKRVDGVLLYGIIDKNGNEIFPCEYDYMSNVVDGQVIAGKDGVFNGLNLDGTDALGMSFDNYPKVSGFLGWSNTESAVFNPNGYYKKENNFYDEKYISGSKATETDHGFYIFGDYLYGLADPNENILLEEENIAISPCDFEAGLFQVWYEDENGNSATYYADFKGNRRTPDFPVYSNSEEYRATPVFKGTTGYGILPKLLSEDEVKEFENL